MIKSNLLIFFKLNEMNKLFLHFIMLWAKISIITFLINI